MFGPVDNVFRGVEGLHEPPGHSLSLISSVFVKSVPNTHSETEWQMEPETIIPAESMPFMKLSCSLKAWMQPFSLQIFSMAPQLLARVAVDQAAEAQGSLT